MKKMRAFVLAFCALVVLSGIAASPSSAALPRGHEKYMKIESYKAAFEQYMAGVEEAKERLTPDEYGALEKENDEAIEESVKEDMESGTSEADAYETAYWMRYEQIGRELRWDWLRKNADDAQGFYRLKSDRYDGRMTLEKGDEEDEYAVEINVIMKKEPYNSGDFEGLGKLSSGPANAKISKMAVSDGDNPEVITITFDGETAKLTSSEAFMESGMLGAGVTIDGEYVREKK
jgi:hypothetical protein